MLPQLTINPAHQNSSDPWRPFDTGLHGDKPWRITVAIDGEAKGDQYRSFYRLSAGVVAFAALAGGTSAVGHQPLSFLQTAHCRVGSTSHGFGNEFPDSVSVPSALAEMRRRAALTWDDLAKIFAVSRRAVHLWASGERLSVLNDAKVRQLYVNVRERNGVHPAQIRADIMLSYGIAPSKERRPREALMKTPIVEINSSPVGATPTATKRYVRGKARQA